MIDSVIVLFISFPFLPAQLVGLLLSKGAMTIYKNTYGNTPLKVAIGAKAASWIRRVNDGGEPERRALAEELLSSMEEERVKADQIQQEIEAK